MAEMKRTIAELVDIGDVVVDPDGTQFNVIRVDWVSDRFVRFQYHTGRFDTYHEDASLDVIVGGATMRYEEGVTP